MNRESGFTPPEAAKSGKKSTDKPKETTMGKIARKYRNLAGGIMLGGMAAGGVAEGIKHREEIGEFAQKQVDEIHRGDAKAGKALEDYVSGQSDVEDDSEENKGVKG